MQLPTLMRVGWEVKGQGSVYEIEHRPGRVAAFARGVFFVRRAARELGRELRAAFIVWTGAGLS